MKTEAKQDFKILSDHIASIQSKKAAYITHKQDSITRLTNAYSSNVSQIESLISTLEAKESQCNSQISTKQAKLSTLSSSIKLIQSQVAQVKKKHNDSIQQSIQSLSLKRAFLISTRSLYPSQRSYRRIQKERKAMLGEELNSCKISLISLASRIESHSEFVMNILKSKSILSTSLEQLNEIPLNHSFAELSSNDFTQLGEYLYAQGREELNITSPKESFIGDFSVKKSIDEVIDYLIQITQSQLPRNLLEYVFIAILRIIAYENILERRLKFVNDCNANNLIIDSSQREIIGKGIKAIDNEIKHIEEDRNNNDQYLLQMENDLNAMIEYSTTLTSDIDTLSRGLLCIQKDLLFKINCLKQDNSNILTKIDMKKNKMLQTEEELNRDIDSMNHLKLTVTQEERKDNYSTISKPNGFNHQSPPQFFYPITMNKNDVMLTEKIAPLFKGATVLKRSIVNVKKKIYESYTPIHRNKKVNPLDWNFKKSYVLVDDKMTKLIFQKLTPLEKNLEIALTSLSRIEVPLVTKSLVFITRLCNKLIRKIQLKSEIDEWILRNQSKVIELYNKGNKSSNYDLDERILDKQYRDLLLEANCYLLYVYLKPDEDTKIEMLFSAYEDFKAWINGLEEVINNSKEVWHVIKHFMI